MNVSIIIPAFNEEKEIGKVVGRLQRLFAGNSGVEIIVVNDASTDATREAAIREGNISLIDNQRNLGYGASIKAGIRASKFDTIMIIDADNTYPVHEIPLLLREAGGNDMVVGSRLCIRYPRFNWIKQRGRDFIDFVCGFLAGRSIPDINSGLRIFSKEKALKHMDELCDRFSFTTSMTLIMFFNRYSVEYVDIDYCIEPTERKSKVKMYRDGIKTLMIILGLGFKYVPLRALMLVSIPVALGLLLMLVIGGVR